MHLYNVTFKIFTGAVQYQLENFSQIKKNRHFKEHFCPYCSYSTYRTSNLKAHLLTHTGERPFACPECHFTFNQKQTLKRHMIAKHKYYI